MNENEVVIIDEEEIVDYIYDNIEEVKVNKDTIRKVIELHYDFLKEKDLI